jgi:hypothetical protein
MPTCPELQPRARQDMQTGRQTDGSQHPAGRQAPEAGHERPLQIVAAQQQRCRCSLAVGAAARRLGLQLLRAANKAGSGSVGHENCRASVMLEGRGTHCWDSRRLPASPAPGRPGARRAGRRGGRPPSHPAPPPGPCAACCPHIWHTPMPWLPRACSLPRCGDRPPLCAV